MKTLEEIKAELMALKPSRIYEINGVEHQLLDAEFDKAVNDRAQMVLEQLQFEAAQEADKALKISGYQKLGLTADEIKALLG